MKRLAILALLCLPAIPAGASPDSAVLARAQAAERNYDYVGTQSIRLSAGRQIEASVLVAHVKGGPVCRRVLRMSGGDSSRPLAGRPLGGMLQAEGSISLLLRNHDLVAGGEATVAGRPTQVYLIRPKRPGNPDKQIWLDRETGLLLKSVRHNWEGRQTAQSEFEDIRIGRNLPEAKEQCAATPRPQPRPPARKLGFTPVQPTWLPAGYEYQGQASFIARERPTAHLRYSNGLNTISLFEQAAGGPREPRRSREMGFSRLLTRRLGSLEVALIADLSPQDLKHILDSLPTP